MSTQQLNRVDELFMHDIAAIDLSMIKMKLADKEEGCGWDKAKCDLVEKVYKNFIALKRTYPETDIVPNQDVDKFWHQHILDTKKYAEDCEIIFGYFVHHYPYFGMNGDRQNLISAFEQTKTLYERHFNESYAGSSSKCKRTACKPQKCR